MTATTKQIVNVEPYFARVLSKVDYEQELPEVLRERQALNLTERLNAMIQAGAAFDVSADDFQLRGAILCQSDRDFLRVNKKPILCILQQSLPQKHLFSHSKHSFSDFAFEIAERESLLTEQGNVSIEAHFEAVRAVTAKWFKDLLVLISDPVS